MVDAQPTVALLVIMTLLLLVLKEKIGSFQSEGPHEFSGFRLAAERRYFFNKTVSLFIPENPLYAHTSIQNNERKTMLFISALVKYWFKKNNKNLTKAIQENLSLKSKDFPASNNYIFSESLCRAGASATWCCCHSRSTGESRHQG